MTSGPGAFDRKGPVALIAGEGALPVAIAEKLSEEGTPPLILTLRNDLELFRPLAGKLIHLRAPSLGRCVREIKAWGTSALIMAGRIPKRFIYCLPLLFDPLTRSVLAHSLRDDHSLLGSIVEAFEREGIQVLPYWQILPEFVASPGRLAERDPTEKEWADIRCGREILRVTLPCSFGQAVVVADGAVVAVEAMEGTDAMIERAGALSGRGTVVKMMKTSQDLRYDLPTIGPASIENMHRAGLTCLAVEAGRTLILSPDDTLSLAGKYGIAVVGITPSDSESEEKDSLSPPAP
ncbi:MAG: UDP-2,3-diacylglucosamine diphosphatase LpxI [Fretibacterium sp.]|nr:UDP-2,3-diacylglucosamine diphosphatase LpxI [Fretibacterium sp.]